MYNINAPTYLYKTPIRDFNAPVYIFGSPNYTFNAPICIVSPSSYIFNTPTPLFAERRVLDYLRYGEQGNRVTGDNYLEPS